jgi:hypothetical protein
LIRLLGWLAEHPGDTWQQRWLVSGADAMGNAGWWRALLAWARPRNPRAGLSASSNLRVCALLLAGADVIRPSLDWVLTPRAPQNRADWGRRVAAAADGDYLELPGAHLSQGHSSAWWEPVGVRRPVAVTMSARPDAVPRRPGRPCDSSSGRLAG